MQITNFWTENFTEGYYDKLISKSLSKNKGLNGYWHYLTYIKVSELIKNSNYNLDFACGSGTFIGMFFHKKCVGYDISRLQIKYANSKYKNRKFIFTDNKEMIQEMGPYESITILGLIEFLNDAEIINLLNEMYDLLLPDGQLVLTTPNYKIPMKILLAVLNLTSQVDYSSVTVNKLQTKKLKQLLSKSNFKTIKIYKSHNLGILASLVSYNFAEKLESIFSKLFRNKFGLILYVSLKKNEKIL